MALALHDIANISTGYDWQNGGWAYLWLEPSADAVQQDFSDLKALTKGRSRVLDARIIAVDPYLRETGDNAFPDGWNFKPERGICFGWRCGQHGEHAAGISQEALAKHVLPVLAQHLGIDPAELQAFLGRVRE
ncbi:MAG: hypothetical protein J0L97_10680 [Alphaproteobacteria bacterium]|nr:hypothetical protein [Alphaproteobacteria bacterium]